MCQYGRNPTDYLYLALSSSTVDLRQELNIGRTSEQLSILFHKYFARIGFRFCKIRKL